MILPLRAYHNLASPGRCSRPDHGFMNWKLSRMHAGGAVFITGIIRRLTNPIQGLAQSWGHYGGAVALSFHYWAPSSDITCYKNSVVLKGRCPFA
jgi:hypothetical protein